LGNRERRTWLAIWIILIVGGSVILRAQGNECERGFEFDGGCIATNELRVIHDGRDAVEAAVAKHGGKVSQALDWTPERFVVQFEVHGLNDLRRIKADIEAAGLEVQFVPLLELYSSG
jgi:hypothetical protein